MTCYSTYVVSIKHEAIEDENSLNACVDHGFSSAKGPVPYNYPQAPSRQHTSSHWVSWCWWLRTPGAATRVVRRQFWPCLGGFRS